MSGSRQTLTTLDDLNDGQRAFVRHIVAGLQPIDAATLSGYAVPAAESWRLMRHAGVIAAIREETTRRLVTESAPLALRVLHEVLGDSAAPANARVAAAKTLLDRGGYVAQSQSPKPDGASIAEKDTRELHDMIARLESELADRARPVTVSQVIDNAE
jgi:hypothetical protein